MFWRLALAFVGPGGPERYVGRSNASLQFPTLQLWMVMGLGMCMHSKGLRGCGCEGPMQDTTLDWIPYPQETEHWRVFKTKVSKKEISEKNKMSKRSTDITFRSKNLTCMVDLCVSTNDRAVGCTWLHSCTSHLKVQTCTRQGTVVAGLTTEWQFASATALSVPLTNWTQDTVL